MVCRRCQGFMVPEWCTDLEFDIWTLRCVNCGAIVDPTIDRHQGVPTVDKRPILAAS